MSTAGTDDPDPVCVEAITSMMFSMDGDRPRYENEETKDVQNKTDLSQKGNGGKWMHN